MRSNEPSRLPSSEIILVLPGYLLDSDYASDSKKCHSGRPKRSQGDPESRKTPSFRELLDPASRLVPDSDPGSGVTNHDTVSFAGMTA